MVVSYNLFHSPKLWQSAKEVIARVLDTTTEEITLKETCEGSFSVILRFQVEKEDYALRIRLRESDFGFEKVVKEPFAILVLNSYGFSDRELGIEIQKLHRQQYCGLLEHPFIGKFYYSDWSKRFDILPYTFSIYQWKKGKSLYSAPTFEHFQSAGKLLANLHQKTFLSCYSSILEIGSKPLLLHDSILSVAISQYEKAFTNGGSKAILDELIKWINLKINKLPVTYKAVFCHYDFSGSNLIIGEDNTTIFALDFDNWKVSICEDDFSKLFHWTVINPITHKRTSSPKHIENFMEGYRSGGGTVDECLLHIKEAEWLFRVYAHSLYRECTDFEEYQQSSFPSSRYYEQAISMLLELIS